MAAELMMVPIEKCIVEADSNTRQKGVGDISDLVNSMKVKGVLEPLIGKARENKAEEVEICVGFRRHAAAQKAGLKKIPILVHKRRDLTKQKMLELNIIENVQRENLNPVDEAYAYQKMQTEHGMSVDEICASIGIKKSRVQNRIRLLKLEDVVRDAVHEERIPFVSAIEIDRLPKKKQAKYVEIAEDFSGAKLRALIDRELERLQGTDGGTAPPTTPPTDPADVTENVRLIKQCSGVICSGLGYSGDEKARVKQVNFRMLEPDDLTVVAKLFDNCADQVPDDIDFNDKAEKELVEFVEGGAPKKVLDDERPIVRQMIIRGLAERAKELAVEKAKGSGKRAKVTFALAKEVIDEFYAEAEEVEEK